MPDLHPFKQDSELSQYSESDDASVQGAKLFAETIAAHGGEDFLQLQTLKITGKGEFTTPPQTGGLKVPLAAFTFYIATAGRSRLEARSPGGPILFVACGQDRGGFMVLAGRTFPLPAEQTNGIEPTEFLRATARQGYPITAVPEDTRETTDGKTLLCYDVHRSQGGTTRVFVESDTKLVRKMVTETTRGEMTILLSHYQLVSGLPIFGEMQLLENGASVLKIISSEITLDEPLKDALFEKA
jgi:hypothetical protein